MYLGGLVTSSGGTTAELARRLGEGRASFQKLVAVWKHANIPKIKKREIFEACVVSKVLYGLDSLWLLSGQLRKLDAFDCNRLRNIAEVAPPFICRISNQNV